MQSLQIMKSTPKEFSHREIYDFYSKYNAYQAQIYDSFHYFTTCCWLFYRVTVEIFAIATTTETTTKLLLETITD